MKRSVGLRCTICNHPARPQVDLAIATGLSKRAVAERFGLSRHAVWRHAQAHLTAEMRAALATKLLQREGDTRRILLEEGAGVTGFVSDAMQAALDPMLAVSKARLIEMSSPNGKRGHFYENWLQGVGVERIKIIGRECPRIGAEFLDKMRQKLGPMLFAQEFEGEFIDAESSAFSSEMIERALADDFERFLQ